VNAFDWLGRQLFDYVHGRQLVYAACWEDPAVDCQALQIGPDDVVLAITSGGCNTLHYLLQEPRQVLAVDLNFRQNALLELKLAGIRNLAWPDFFALFGRGKLRDARQVYEARLRHDLSSAARRFWDRNINMFDRSRSFYLQSTSGIAARWFRRYIDYVLRLGPEIDQLLNAPDVATQSAVYETQIRQRFWNQRLVFLLSRPSLLALSGIPPQQRRQVLAQEPSLLARLQRRAEHVIHHLALRDNYFWRLYLMGEFTENCCPEYLKPHNFERLKGLIDRVTIHTDSVQGFLERTDARPSCLLLLDHMDWLADRFAPQLAAEWQAIANRAAPDARFVWRTLGVDKEFVDNVRVTVAGRERRLGDLLCYDDQMSQQLMEQERVTVYGGLFVARWRERGGG
jgi:S-adenosylmethionine-diacylglycerol 3-amino-3-carboxypropyl transferase